MWRGGHCSLLQRDKWDRRERTGDVAQMRQKGENWRCGTYLLKGLTSTATSYGWLGTGGSGGMGTYVHLLATLLPPDWLCIKAGSCVRHWNVLVNVWAKSQASINKLQFLTRKESRSGSNRRPSAYQHSALPLGHTGQPPSLPCHSLFKSALRFTCTPATAERPLFPMTAPSGRNNRRCVSKRDTKYSHTGMI